VIFWKFANPQEPEIHEFIGGLLEAGALLFAVR